LNHLFSKLRGRSLRWTLLLPALALLTSCSTDPAHEKVKYLQSGDRYLNAGKFSEAAIQFQNAVELDPRFADAYYGLAQAHLKTGNVDAAFRELVQATALNPSNVSAQLELGRLQIARRQYADAEATARRVISSSRNTPAENASAHMLLGEVFQGTQKLDLAVQELQAAVSLDPRRFESYAALGAVELQAGKTQDAEAAYRRALAIDPKSPAAHISLGEFYFSQNRLAEAEVEIGAACRLEPQAVAPRLMLGRIYTLTGRLDEAERLYGGLKDLAPDDAAAYEALGFFYLSEGQTEKAEAEFAATLKAHPKDTLVKGRLVETLIDLNRRDEALTLNREILSTNPGDPHALVSEGRLLIRDGKYQQAGDSLQKATVNDPNSPAAFYYLGVTQKELGNLSLARSSFDRALKLNPNFRDAETALASLEVKAHDYDQALVHVRNSVTESPESPSAYLVEAEALLGKGDVSQGEARLQDALRLDPVSLPSLAVLVKLYAKQGRSPEAIHRLRDLLIQFPQNAGLHLLLGVAYFSVKDIDHAEASVKQAIALNAKTLDAYTLLADIDLARGDTESGKHHLQQAIDANPRVVSNYMALVTEFEKEGKWEEATRLCERARNVDPASPMIANELVYLYLDHGGDVNAAMSLAQIVRRQAPDAPSGYDAMGWAYYKLGSFGPAIGQLKESVEKVPANPMFRYHLGMAYRASGQVDLARQQMRKILQQYPDSPNAAGVKLALQQMSSRN
jgi:tetratricopeptide (TPR) repeat protein